MKVILPLHYEQGGVAERLYSMQDLVSCKPAAYLICFIQFSTYSLLRPNTQLMLFSTAICF